eukprot:1073816-Amphidinium_carterae.1
MAGQLVKARLVTALGKVQKILFVSARHCLWQRHATRRDMHIFFQNAGSEPVRAHCHAAGFSA